VHAVAEIPSADRMPVEVPIREFVSLVREKKFMELLPRSKENE